MIVEVENSTYQPAPLPNLPTSPATPNPSPSRTQPRQRYSDMFVELDEQSSPYEELQYNEAEEHYSTRTRPTIQSPCVPPRPSGTIIDSLCIELYIAACVNGAVMPGHRVTVPKFSAHVMICQSLHYKGRRVVATLVSDFSGGCQLEVGCLQVAREINPHQNAPADVTQGVAVPTSDVGIAQFALATVKQALNKIDSKLKHSSFAFEIMEMRPSLKTVFGFAGESKVVKYEAIKRNKASKDIYTWDEILGEKWDLVGRSNGMIAEMDFQIQKMGFTYKLTGKVRVVRVTGNFGTEPNYRDLMRPLMMPNTRKVNGTTTTYMNDVQQAHSTTV